MAGPNYGLDKGFVAGEAIGKFLFVKLVATETINVCDTQGEFAIGVVQESITAADATNGRIAAVRVTGVSRVICGDTLTAQMTQVTVGTDGRAEIAATGDNVVGIALQTGVDGDHIDVLLTPSGVIHA